MCQAAEKTAAALINAVEPDFVELITLEGIADTPNGEAAINAYKALDAAAQNWTPGTSATVAIESANTFTAVFQTLPIPDTAKGLEGLISAAIVTVIGIFTANSPAPTAVTAATPALAAHEQAVHADTVAEDTEAKVTAMTGVKVGWVTKARVMAGDHGAIADQWKSEWKKTAKESGPKYASLAA